MTSLELTAENLRKSIAARKAQAGTSEDFQAVTAQEESRLREVEAAIAAEAKTTKPASK